MDVIPTAIPGIDHKLLLTFDCLPMGGIPRHGITHIFGTEGVGVTSLAMSIALHARWVLWIDLMHQMGDVGKQSDHVWVLRPPEAFNLLDVVNLTEDEAAFDLIVVDALEGLASGGVIKTSERWGRVAAASQDGPAVVVCGHQMFRPDVRRWYATAEATLRTYALLGIHLPHKGRAEVAWSSVCRYPAEVSYSIPARVREYVP